MTTPTSVFDRIFERARQSRLPARIESAQKDLYDLHPDLRYRIPLIRVSSDEQAADLSGFTSTARYYAVNGWVNKAIRILADNLSPLYVRVTRGAGKDVKPLDDHELTMRLQSPNPDQGAVGLWKEWVTDQMLGGEWGLEVVKGRAGSKVLELWPRQPQHITVHAGALGRRYRRDDGEGEPYRLEPDQMVHFKFYNPLNPWRGLAPISAIRNGILIDQMAQAWSRLFFKNQARPDFAVIAPEGITKTEKKEMALELDIEHGGDNVHRPIILEHGITDIKTFSYAPKDLEWLAQREWSRDEVGGVFGVPDEIMGYGKDTYENFNTADRVLWTLTIIPLVRFRDDVLTRFFRNAGVLQADEQIETDLSEVPQLQEDRSAKLEQWNLLVNQGVPGQVASEFLGLDLPDYPSGNVGHLPFGLIPVGRSRPQPAADREGRESARKARKKTVFPEYGSRAHELMWQAKQARANDYVADMQRALKREFQRQQSDVARKLRNSRVFGRGQFKTNGTAVKDLPPVEELFDRDTEAKKFIEALRKSVEDAIAGIGEAELGDLGGGEFDIDAPAVRDGIELMLETVSTKVNDTTWNELIDLFQEAEAEGLGIPAMQERLSAYFGDRKSDWQTERIARTTMTGAANFGSNEAWSQSGVVDEHMWISALLPDRTRDEHAAAHGQVVKLGERFTVGGESLRYPGDPEGRPENIVNCLCVDVAVVAED